MFRETKEACLMWASLFTTLGTLLCCALPSLLIFLGFGTAIASLTFHFSWLVVLSEHKFWVFLSSGLCLLIGDWLLRRPGRVCPTDPKLAQKCKRLTAWNFRIMHFAVLLWTIGFVAAYLVNPINIWLHAG